MGSRLRGNDGRGCEAALFSIVLVGVLVGMWVTGVSGGDGGWIPAFAGMTGGGVRRHCFRSCWWECGSRASPGVTGDGFPPSRE